MRALLVSIAVLGALFVVCIESRNVRCVPLEQPTAASIRADLQRERREAECRRMLSMPGLSISDVIEIKKGCP